MPSSGSPEGQTPSEAEPQTGRTSTLRKASYWFVFGFAGMFLYGLDQYERFDGFTMLVTVNAINFIFTGMLFFVVGLVLHGFMRMISVD